jgi:hypothetical protein
MMLMEEIRKPLIYPGYRQSKRRVVLAAALFSALTTPSFLLLPEGSAQARLFDIISIIGFGVLTLGWCYYDALERGAPLGAGFRILIVLLGVLGLFIYLVKSRGLRRGLLSVGVAIVLIVGVILVGAVSSVIVGLAQGFG